MPIVHVARPFIWRIGHNAVLIEKGEQDLTPAQIEHATKHGFLQKAVKPALQKAALKEQTNE